MPDVHQGPVVPNGLAVATSTRIYPELVGTDIGCGLSAIRLAGDADKFRHGELKGFLGVMRQVVPTLMHPAISRAPDLPDSCPDHALSHDGLAKLGNREGRWQLGTLGRGNHFIEFAMDEHDHLWLMIHSGSRAMGQAITAHHLARAVRDHPAALAGLELSNPAGQDYLNDLRWALAYATENRLVMINRLADQLESRFKVHLEESSYVDCPHNLAQWERHGQLAWLIHRKSANPAALDEPGIIPGSMATGSRIVRGLGNPSALCSSSHGAGRAMSRTLAAGTIKTQDFIGRMTGVVFDQNHADALRDEAPQAYRDLDLVMRAQKDLVKIVARLSPVLNDKRF